MNVVLTKTLCTIETKCSYVRSHESTIGDFFADIMRIQLSADCALLNAGSIRSDRFYDAGYLSAGDWIDMFPYRTKLFKVEVSGALLAKILEQGIAKYPSFEGRFPSISNIKFDFDADLPPYERIVPGSLKIGGVPVLDFKKYSIVAPSFIVSGLDGYEYFKESTNLMCESEAPVFIDTLFQIFRLPQKEVFLKEYEFCKHNLEEINQNFLLKNVQDKVIIQQSVFDFVQDIGYNQAILAADELSSSSDEEGDQEDTTDELDLGELKLERRSSYILQ